MDDARNAVATQLMRPEPPISMTMLGMRVAVINAFIACSSAPPSRRLRSSIRRGVSNARQLSSVVSPGPGVP
jgi:hypothetical protein